MRAVRRLASWSNLLLAGVLMLAVWLLLVWVSVRPGLRWVVDLSPGQRFSVSPATEELLAEVRQQELAVEFHTFLNPLPQVPTGDELARQNWQILDRLQGLTVDLLRRYSELGGEAVRVVHHDLARPQDGTRAAAQKFGVGVGDTLVVTVKGRHKRLSLEGDMAVVEFPAMRQSPGLPTTALPILKDYKGEEALSSALKSLLVQGTPVVYFLKGYREADRQSATLGASYGLLQQALEREGFECRELELGKAGAVPEDAAVAAVLEPRGEFSDRDAEALFAFLRRGGRLFLNYSFLEVPGWNPTGGELGRLLGYEVGQEVVFHLIPDPSRPQAPGLDGNPGVQRLDVYGMNPNHPITRPLDRGGVALQLASGRELRRQAGLPDGVRVDDLLYSGPWAWLAHSGPDGRHSLRAPAQQDAFAPRTLGMVIDVDGEREGVIGHAVVLSAMGLHNGGIAVNRDLGLNIFNWLAERKALVTVRGSRYQARFLEVGPQQLSRIGWLLKAGVPALFLLAGLMVWWRRSRG